MGAALRVNMNNETANLITYNRQVKARLNASNVPHGSFYWMLAIHTATERLGRAPISADLGEEMNLAAIPQITKIEGEGYATITMVKNKRGMAKAFKLTQAGIDAMVSIVEGRKA